MFGRDGNHPLNGTTDYTSRRRSKMDIETPPPRSGNKMDIEEPSHVQQKYIQPHQKVANELPDYSSAARALAPQNINQFDMPLMNLMGDMSDKYQVNRHTKNQGKENLNYQQANLPNKVSMAELGSPLMHYEPDNHNQLQNKKKVVNKLMQVFGKILEEM